MTRPGSKMFSMRRYWTFSLAIGGGAALLGLALAASGLLEPAVKGLGDWYRSRAWAPAGDWLRFRSLEFVMIAVLPLGLAFGMIEVTKIPQKAAVAGAAVLLAFLLSPLLALYGLLMDVISLLSACLLAILGAALFARTEFGSRKRRLELALGTRVSSSVFQNLLDSPVSPSFEAASREVTIIVCRILPVTGGEKTLAPADALKRGSWFLRAVSSFLLSRGAYLEEAGPERVRAVFGMLGEDPDHAVKACRVAFDLKGRLRGLAQEFESRWFHALDWGVGVASGTMSVGLCGDPGRYLLAGVGGDSDFADRLALANARLSSDVLLGPETYRLVRDRFEVRPLEMLYDPMTQRLLESYQLLAPSESVSEEERQRRDWFWKGVIHLRQSKYDEALECFSRARVPGVEDRPLAQLLAQAQEGVATPGSRSVRLIREFTDDGRARLLERL